jgi:SAM-dependent methyltransferase
VGHFYAGNNVLELLEEARNYNDFLLNEILKAGADAKLVLDFGAGSGTFARAFRKARPGTRILCVEPDPQSQERLREQGFSVFSRLEESAATQPDFIYSLNVLEHIEDDLSVLKFIRSILRREAKLFIYVPAFQVLFSEFDRRVGHFRRYRKKSLVALAEKAGFIVEKARYCDSLGFVAALLYRFIGRSGTINSRQIAIFDRIVFPVSRALDYVLSPFFGKNLIVIAHADEELS